jgi:peptidoglycan/xylan/chitin deacetylase (PgdA/CDA1 family)
MGRNRLFTRRDFLRAGAAVGVGTSGLTGCLSTMPSDVGADAMPDPTMDATPTKTSRTTRTETFEPPTDVCQADAAVAESGPLRRDTNNRRTSRCVGSPLANMETIEGWSADAGEIAADDDTSFTGTQSLRIEAGPENERAAASLDLPGGVDLSERDVSLAVRTGTDNPASNVIVQLFAPDARNRIDHWQHLTPGPGWKRLDLGPTRVVGDPDLEDVRRLRIVSYTGGGERVRFNADAVRTTPKLDQGYVLLTFDDNLLSQYETAFPLTEEYGFPGVIGVIPGTGSKEGHVGIDDLSEMHDAGWDVVSHPQRAEPLPDLSEADRRAAFEESKRWLLDHGFEDGSRFVIWPYGVTDGATLDLGGTFHAMGFSGGVHPSGCPLMGPLSVSRVNGDNVERTRKMIDYALEYNQVAVVMYHPIGTSDRRVSAEQFEATLQYLDDNDASVVTASHLWDEIL